LGTLRARVGRVRGVTFEGRHPDDRLRRLVFARLHVGARQLTPQAARAASRHEFENLCRRWRGERRHRALFLTGAPWRRPELSRRWMNSSSGRAAIVMPAIPPRAPSSTDTREIVALSGASTTVTKSYGPSTAYWATTRAPMRFTSALTFRIQP